MRIVYCHHAGGVELEPPPELPDGYRTVWEWAVCQVDSRQGGYVRERDAAGQIVRQHPAGQGNV